MISLRLCMFGLALLGWRMLSTVPVAHILAGALCPNRRRSMRRLVRRVRPLSSTRPSRWPWGPPGVALPHRLPRCLLSSSHPRHRLGLWAGVRLLLGSELPPPGRKAQPSPAPAPINQMMGRDDERIRDRETSRTEICIEVCRLESRIV